MAKNNIPVVVANVHHEILCRDAYAAGQFFQDIFGSTQVEIDFSKNIEKDFELKCRHEKINGRIYQFITPNDEVSNKLKNWYDRSILPGIHNVTFAVSDAEALAATMRRMGVASMGEVISKTPDMEHDCKVYMYDATKQCGMRFEFIQADMSAPAPDPEPVVPGPVILGNVHLEMLVDNPAEAEAFMEEVFGAERCEVAFARNIEEDFELTNRHVSLAGDTYQLIRPNDSVSGPLKNWYDRDVQPGIHNVTFAVADAEGLARKLREAGCRCMGTMLSKAPNMVDDCLVYMYDATEQCGMRFEFVQA